MQKFKVFTLFLVLLFSGCSFQYLNYETRTRIADYNGNHDDTITWLAGPGVTITGPDAEGMMTISVDTSGQPVDIETPEPWIIEPGDGWEGWDGFAIQPSTLGPQYMPDDIKATGQTLDLIPDTARIKITYHQGNGVLITNDNIPVIITVVGYDFNGVLVDSFQMVQQGGALVIPND